jgi:hypothetical protein
MVEGGLNLKKIKLVKIVLIIIGVQILPKLKTGLVVRLKLVFLPTMIIMVS